MSVQNLPQLNAPSFTTVIPSTKENVKFRSFLVKEEKLLLMAKESDEIVDIINIVKDIISSCTFNSLDVDSLATFDVEYLFLQIRSKSVGRIVNMDFICNNTVDGKLCGEKIPISIDLDELEVSCPENHTNKFKITDNIGCVMKYPGLDLLSYIKELSTNSSNNEILKVIIELIDYIWEGDNVFYAKDTPKESLEEFIDSMTIEQFGCFKTFFQTIPSIEHEIVKKCPKCDKVLKHKLKGLQDFFV